MADRLEETNKGFRAEQTKSGINSQINAKDEYNSSHSRAISDGDLWGKEPKDGSSQVGNTDDIKARDEMLVRNNARHWNVNKEYSESTYKG